MGSQKPLPTPKVTRAPVAEDPNTAKMRHRRLAGNRQGKRSTMMVEGIQNDMTGSTGTSLGGGV